MSENYRALFPKSSQDFIRALKAPSDPPVAEGPLKVEIAQEAWENESLYVPSKGEVITDWILTKFLKDKDKETPLNPILDTRYWKLLLGILQPGEAISGGTDYRSTKAWLTPLLQRIPMGPVIISFLSVINIITRDDAGDLSRFASLCLFILWPIAVQRMNAEMLLDCFGAFLLQRSLVQSRENTVQIGCTITTSYRNSLANSSNKKKLYQAFLNTHLRTWMNALSKLSTSEKNDVKDTLLDAGMETLFSLDVLRKSQDSRLENSLMQHLQGILIADRDLVLEILPVIFTNYVHALSRNRGTLFTQGPQAQPGALLDEYRQTAMAFFESALDLIDDSQQDTRAWCTRLSLLGTVDREHLFDSEHPDSQIAINRILDLVITVMKENWKDDNQACTTLAVQCLSVIACIDYDTVSSSIPQILPQLLQISASIEPCFDFLELFLAYHTKTRTMNNLLEQLFTSILLSGNFPGTVQERYQTSFSSPIMSSFFLGRLSRALQKFMTEGQCISTMNYMYDVLKSTSERVYEGLERNSPKKRKSAVMDSEMEAGELAATYCLLVRLASVALSSLPMHSLPSSSSKDVRLSIIDFRTDFVHNAVSKFLKAIEKQIGTEAWPIEIVLSADLRLLYVLDVSNDLSLPSESNVKNHSKLTELLSREDVLPELTLDTFRVLFYNISVGHATNHKNIIELLLVYLEKNFAPADVWWSGQAYHLTRSEPGKAESALAIMYMITERWLSEVDRFSSPEQLRRILELILSIKASSERPIQGMWPEHLLQSLLNSAEFWEFKNVRSVFLDIIDEKTKSLDSAVTNPRETTKFLKKAKVYHLLLAFPLEYFSWKRLNTLIRHALLADHTIIQAASNLDHNASKIITTLRTFLKRAYLHGGTIGDDSSKNQSDFLVHLLQELPSLDPEVDPGVRQAFIRATLDLAEVYFSRLLKTSKKSETQPTLSVLRQFTPHAFITGGGLSSSIFMKLVDLLSNEFIAADLHEDIVQAIRIIHGELWAFLLPHMKFITVNNVKEDSIHRCVELAAKWHSLLCLSKWLNIPGCSNQEVPFISDTLVSILVLHLKSGPLTTKGDFRELSIRTFAILLQELDIKPEDDHPKTLDKIFAVYIYLSDIWFEEGREYLDLHLCKTTKNLALKDYVYMLSLAADSLSDQRYRPTSHLRQLVHFSALLLRQHPPHSLTHIQKFSSRCLGILNSSTVFSQGPPELRLEVLEMIAQHCSDQQAALRSLDISGIWLLLSKFLAPCQEHDQDTQTSIFYKIIAILTSLVRFRRDLVTLSLPHLVHILRQLLLTTRGCRPYLGAKQTAFVMNTQPRWLNVENPLGAEEARALSRLLESLNTKTIVRVPTSMSLLESQKVESLVKPFSKHAAYVLKAYIEAMNDPLCILPLDVRKELQPGLFVLCGMISEHSRDALMISALDAGGKATLKTLWKEFDKQRYVGKG